MPEPKVMAPTPEETSRGRPRKSDKGKSAAAAETAVAKDKSSVVKQAKPASPIK